MKTLFAVSILCVSAIILGCGAGHSNLQTIAVSPNPGNAAVTENVVFTAKGTFANNTSRNLTAADGLSWTSSNTAVATIGSNSGSANCVAAGSVTITATAPENLQITVNNGISNTSTNVTGTATLNCT
jgi:trimeric autotransporter adhesin